MIVATVDRWILGPLRRAATGGTFTVVGALRRISWCLQAHAAEHGDDGSFIATWINAIDKRIEFIEAACESEQHSRKMAVKDDPTIRDALHFMLEKYCDEDARELLSYNGDAELRYSGDASRRLLTRLAEHAPPEYREALRWHAQQESARHAFVPKVNGKPPRGSKGEDLSRKPRTTDERLAEKYGDYLAERSLLLEQETGIVNEGDFAYTKEQQDHADILWRSAEWGKGRSREAVRKDLSERRTAWNKLNSPV